MPFKTDKQRKAFFAGQGKSAANIIPSIQNLLYIPFICDENLRNNDKQTNDVNDECVNLEALKLWRTNPEQYRQILLTCLE